VQQGQFKLRILILLAAGLLASLSLPGCQYPSAETRSVIWKSTSLGYLKTSEYLDGGSVGFVFTNQCGQTVMIFVRTPKGTITPTGEELYPYGQLPKGEMQIPRLLVSSETMFRDRQAYVLDVGSWTEKKLIELITKVLHSDLSNEQRQQVSMALAAITERRFDWYKFNDVQELRYQEEIKQKEHEKTRTDTQSPKQ
jgi:hypothetical protein